MHGYCSRFVVPRNPHMMLESHLEGCKQNSQTVRGSEVLVTGPKLVYGLLLRVSSAKIWYLHN